MNWSDAILWGLLAALVLTLLLSVSQGIGLTRMSMPFMLGTMFTPDRDLAKVIGFLVHLANGWAIALLYAAIFQSLGRTGWWLGAILGAFHGLVVLLILIPMLPGLHPRMASAQRGPTPTRELEPPGFLGLNYGHRTPITLLLAHVIYGITLGAFYHLR